MSEKTPILLLVLLCTLILLFSLGPVWGFEFDIWNSFLKTLFEIMAIATGGIWTYLTFIKYRLEYPYAQTEHKIFHWEIDNQKIYLSVIVSFKNSGKVLIKLKNSFVYIRQVRPLVSDLKTMIENAPSADLREGKVSGLFIDNGRQIAWREVGYKEIEWEDNDVLIEPGETEEIKFDFILEKNIETIEVITYFQDLNKKRNKTGWKLTSMYNFVGDTHERK